MRLSANQHRWVTLGRRLIGGAAHPMGTVAIGKPAVVR